MPLTIKEHVDGEWIIEKVVLKEILGERNDAEGKRHSARRRCSPRSGSTSTNVEFEMKLPPTTIDKKYDLYVTVLRKNRRY